LLGLDRSAVHRWALPKARGGSGGLVPAKHHRRLLALASAEGVTLSAADLVGTASVAGEPPKAGADDGLAGPAGDETYGEGLSLRAHSLQSAALAGAAGMSPAMMAAALLHDVGWALGGAHEEVGATFVEDGFGAEVARPIRLHVEAKRYLVACEPGYEAQLSPASRQTLALQGGAMTDQEARRFEQIPGFAEAIALRRIDDQAKDPHQSTVDLMAYRDPLIALALAALSRETP
jgi:gamma-butyrobetaine dioxygenase